MLTGCTNWCRTGYGHHSAHRADQAGVLSALRASYKSMAKMRKLAPRLEHLKERYGDDRQKLHER